MVAVETILFVKYRHANEGMGGFVASIRRVMFIPIPLECEGRDCGRQDQKKSGKYQVLMHHIRYVFSPKYLYA